MFTKIIILSLFVDYSFFYSSRVSLHNPTPWSSLVYHSNDFYFFLFTLTDVLYNKNHSVSSKKKRANTNESKSPVVELFEALDLLVEHKQSKTKKTHKQALNEGITLLLNNIVRTEDDINESNVTAQANTSTSQQVKSHQNPFKVQNNTQASAPTHQTSTQQTPLNITVSQCPLKEITTQITHTLSPINLQLSKRIKFPHWASLFHCRMLICRKLISPDQLKSYEQLMKEYIEVQKENYQSALVNQNEHDHGITFCIIIAQNLLDYLNSHTIDPDNSLIGLLISEDLHDVPRQLLIDMHEFLHEFRLTESTAMQSPGSSSNRPDSRKHQPISSPNTSVGSKSMKKNYFLKKRSHFDESRTSSLILTLIENYLNPNNENQEAQENQENGENQLHQSNEHVKPEKQREKLSELEFIMKIKQYLENEKKFLANYWNKQVAQGELLVVMNLHSHKTKYSFTFARFHSIKSDSTILIYNLPGELNLKEIDFRMSIPLPQEILNSIKNYDYNNSQSINMRQSLIQSPCEFYSSRIKMITDSGFFLSSLFPPFSLLSSSFHISSFLSPSLLLYPILEPPFFLLSSFNLFLSCTSSLLFPFSSFLYRGFSGLL